MRQLSNLLNELPTSEDTDLRELLEDLADLRIARAIAIFETGKVLRLSSQIQQTNADPCIRLLAQQLSAVAAIALISAFLSSGDQGSSPGGKEK